jgi:ERF superfamily
MKTKEAAPTLFADDDKPQRGHQPKPGPKPKTPKTGSGVKAAPKQEIVVHQPASPPAPRSMLEVIATAVRDPACDVAKMQALLDMQERIEANDARKQFTQAFNALQAELPVINKDGIIDHGDGVTAKGNKKLKTRWATYPNIMDICGPLLKKHGFTLSSVIEPSADGLKINVVGYLDHIGGHSRVSRFPMTADATGGKNNQQGWGSSQQYGMRYNAIALLNIVSKAPQDNDNDGFTKKRDPDDPISSGPKLITDDQAAELREAIEDCGVPLDTFLKKFRVEEVASLLASEFKNAMTSCANYKKAKDGQK